MKNSNGVISRKLLIAATTICTLLFLVFKLFEPIFVYNSGWKRFELHSAPSTSEYFGKQWRFKADAANKIAADLYSKINTPALSIAVSVDGVLVWRSSTGYADLEKRAPSSYDHAFRIGSTSKPITSLAIGTLVDQGKLSFNTKIRELDPSLSENLDSITLEHALSHRAGIRNYGVCFCFPIWEHQNTTQFSSLRNSVSQIEESKLKSLPGTSYSYTSLGYNLAGLAAEVSAKQPFSKLVKTSVLVPLKMNHTYLEHKSITNVGVAKPYEIEGNRYKATFDVNQSIRWPSGGFLSTPSDMVRLGNAMLGDHLLSKEVRSKLLTVPEAGRENGGEIYALGWRVSEWPIKGDRVSMAYHHNGVSVGGISAFAVFPEERMVISLMINKNGSNANEVAKAVGPLASVFLD